MSRHAGKEAVRQGRGSQTKPVKTAPLCPECGSNQVVRIVHGIPTPALQKAIDQGEAALADREEWEGMSEWTCKDCGCDWSGAWRRFKKG